MKIEELKSNLSHHIYKVSEKDLNEISSIFNIKILNYKKSEYSVSFKIQSDDKLVFIHCDKSSCASIGKSNKVVHGLSRMVCYGGVFSFADIFKTCMNFYGLDCNLNITELEKLYGEEYDKVLEIFDEMFSVNEK